MGAPAIDDLGDLRLDLTAATQKLLGDTIILADEDWLAPTILPGWMRGHIAAHLAAQATTMEQMVHNLGTQNPLPWQASDPPATVMRGAPRPGLELLEDLDRSAANLMSAFDSMDPNAWNCSLLTSQGLLPVRALPLARLNEVVLHHIDLSVGFTFADIEPRVAEALLKWNLFRAEPRFTQVHLHVSTDSGAEYSFGEGIDAHVSGATSSLLGWITGRLDHTTVLGAEKLNLGTPV